MASLDAQLNQLTTVELLRNAAQTANVNSSNIDVSEYTGSIRVTMVSGNITAGANDSTYTLSLQDSDVTTAANFTNIANTWTLTAASNQATLSSVDIPTRSLRKYFRVMGNITGTSSPSFPITAVVSGIKQTG